jgi:hypothetical protein
MPSAAAQMRSRELIQRINSIGTIFLHGGGVRVRILPVVPDEIRREVGELHDELIELLNTEGESIVDDDAIVLNTTLPRSAAEVNADTRLQRAAAAKRRQYQNGQVVVHNHDGLTGDSGRNSFGRHMELLVRQSNHRKAVENNTIPPAGRYQTKWNIFG